VRWDGDKGEFLEGGSVSSATIGIVSPPEADGWEATPEVVGTRMGVVWRSGCDWVALTGIGVGAMIPGGLLRLL